MCATLPCAPHGPSPSSPAAPPPPSFRPRARCARLASALPGWAYSSQSAHTLKGLQLQLRVAASSLMPYDAATVCLPSFFSMLTAGFSV